ncbi:UNKNOWN [Stylonychia lemnae]|uniref:Uncharacterized protein n=1 Tax=Stylonychia lemnae TaxID=5949 RepID=A0A078AP24_STYLE|nr:UNKNOWN [Stylonychia lemnae]|eukprot:CDW83067.1 UNKNOWN [Stylonychia lemnae]
MADTARKSFILSLKRLKFFFNNLREYEEGLENRADIQSCSPDQLNEKIIPVAKYMEEATKAIVESKKFIDLIEEQENGKLEKLLSEKQILVDQEETELNELKAQIELVKIQIKLKEQEEKNIRDKIANEQKTTQLKVKKLDLSIQDIIDTQNSEQDLIQGKINHLEAKRDKILFEYHRVQQLHQKSQEKNKFLYFFPSKVYNQKERIMRKKEELKLYQSIIEESISFFADKIDENKAKNVLVRQMNNEVHQIIENVLDQEKQFFESDTQDKLKTPPFVMVKRIDRDQNAK